MLIFLHTRNEPPDNSLKISLKRNKLPQFKNLCIEHAQKFRRGLQYHFALPIESELKKNLVDLLKNINLCIYSLYSKAKRLKICTISIAKITEHIYATP